MQYTYLPPRAWQQRLHGSRFKRNSAPVKAVIWVFQKIQMQRIHDPAGKVSRFTVNPV
jgi:hypothetical protein